MKALLISLFILISQNILANNSEYLIKEMESLRDSLKIDDPARMNLTTRLADLYFDVSIQEGKAEDLAIAKKNRLKALDLYTQSLTGSGKSEKATGLNRIKIQFQMARLLTRLNEEKSAESYYLEVLNNKESPKKFIEQSALSLAEWNEDEAKYDLAKKYYDQSISHCEDINSCNYANYRLAWLLYKDTKLDAAIATMEKSLWSKEGIIRESSLTDYLLFISNKESDGSKELEKINAIANKAHRPELIRELVEAYYVAGNRLAGSTTLAELNKRDPNLYYEVRLLEEYYGFRKWEKVTFYLTQLEKRSKIDIPKKIEEAKEVLAILRRFIVQVDAEQAVVPELNIFLKRSIDTYLNIYPNDDMRSKMQAGWLTAENDKSLKISKLSNWIKEDLANGVSLAEIRKLRQTRLSLAQSVKNSPVVIEEALALAEILKGTNEAEEFNYVAAREMYAQKNFLQSLPIFQSVVGNIKAKKEISQWALLSQNLILDIYNGQKNYDGIISQVGFWRDSIKDLAITEEMKKESKSIDQILVQVQFYKAEQMKESIEALNAFTEICLSGQYMDKSCPNAKILAAKFKDQDKLIKVLEKMGDEKSLITEYELMGNFALAAKLQEKIELKSNPQLPTFLKVALLYELDHDLDNRNRILDLMITSLKNEKMIPINLEKVIFTTLDEAMLINEKSLKLPWSISLKLKVASRLGISNPSESSNKEAQKILMSSREANGPLWSKAVLTLLGSELNKTNKIKFYGAQSKVLFKKRTTAVSQFVSMAKPLLDGADLDTRIYILHMLKMSYKTLASEILNTPIPDGLDEQTLNAVTTQISTMADPFDRAQEDYDRLLTEQLAQATDPAKNLEITNNLSKEVVSYASFVKVVGDKTGLDQKALLAAEIDQTKELRTKLLIDPENVDALVKLKDFYSKNENARFAAYYAGRIDNLKQVE